MNNIFFRSTLITGLLLGSLSLFAQAPTGYYVDAARFSQYYIGGTGRFQGFAGAGTALGADLSSPALNPAGLGMYRKSEVALSTGLGFAGSTSNYLGEQNKDSRPYFYFPNFGIAINDGKDDIEKGAWRGGTFAITYNRINNFQNQVFLSGINEVSSINTAFVNLLNDRGYTPDDLDVPVDALYSLEELIYMTYLSEYDFDNQKFYNPFDSTKVGTSQYLYHQNSTPAYQEQLISTRGAQNQFDFAYGGNFSDRFYVGASLGIVAVRHSLTKDYYESAEDSSALEELTFSQTLDTKGYGFNFKVGLIARPIDNLRLGLSLQTPTAYYLTENYQYYIQATFNENYEVPGSGFFPGIQDNKTVPLEFKYRVTTPAIVRGGLAYFFGKLGFITADLEYVPYSMVSLNTKDDRTLFNGDNRIIKNNFNGALNYRVGGEVRFNIWRFRAGYALTDDPLKGVDGLDRSVNTFSGGVGIKLSEFYFDTALTHSRSEGLYTPYSISTGAETPASVDYRNTSFIISFGTYF